MNFTVNIKPCLQVVLAGTQEELSAKVEAIKSTILPTQELVVSVVLVAAVSIVEAT